MIAEFFGDLRHRVSHIRRELARTMMVMENRSGPKCTKRMKPGGDIAKDTTVV
jgi:hypothetical protein